MVCLLLLGAGDGWAAIADMRGELAAAGLDPQRRGPGTADILRRHAAHHRQRRRGADEKGAGQDEEKAARCHDANRL